MDRTVKVINGPRGSFLVCVGLLSLTHAASCLPVFSAPALPFGMELLNRIVPIGVYATIWLVAAAISFVAAFSKDTCRGHEVVDVAAFGISTGMYLLWGITYMLGWSFDDDDSIQWIYAAIYVLVAGLVAAAARMTNPLHRKAVESGNEA